MNRLALTVVFFFFILLIYGQIIKLENLKNDVIDYGVIQKNSEKWRKILVRNIGKKPLIISNVISSCGCTVLEWTKTPIKPKKIGFISVSYDTSMVGSINKIITINSNDIETPNKTVKIQGKVIEYSSIIKESLDRFIQ